MVIVTAKVRMQEGKAEESLEAFRWMHPLVMKDPGAMLYSLQRSKSDPNEFLFYEKYEDDEAFAYHLSTDHFKTLSAKIDPLMAAPPEIGQWEEIE
jgi:autoinducer 2-degrading protein